MTTTVDRPIVIIDDDKAICKTLKLHFDRKDLQVFTANSGKEGLELLESHDSAIVILDVRLPDVYGIELLGELNEKNGNYYSIIITAYPNMESTVKAVQCGVGEYIHKPIDINELDTAVEKATNFFLENETNNQKLIPISNIKQDSKMIIGKSQVMKEIYKIVGMVSMSTSTVLITGESGTGKELVANAIHANSPNSSAPFISVNCSAIVDTLLESELFGHAKGAFTGALTTKEGWFSLARRGTIFLDEIGEMSINLQAKLLRVLQEREFDMVGGQKKLKAECRIITATNKNLESMVANGTFREDLYYRIKVINIHLPPLRDRMEDIPELVTFLIAKKCTETARNIKYITPEVIDYLASEPWYGNIRELENAITHAVVMSTGDTLHLKHVTSTIHVNGNDLAPPSDEKTKSSKANEYQPVSLNEIEKEQIIKTLDHTKWHKGKTCEILGITRPRLDRKIKKYTIKHLYANYEHD